MEHKMSVVLIVALSALVTSSFGGLVKRDLADDLNDSVQGKKNMCLVDDNCAAYEFCDTDSLPPTCAIKLWVLIVVIVVVFLLLSSIISCICCCCRKMCS